MPERLMPDYLPRLADSRLRNMLEFSPAVVIEGPRDCSKTTTATQAASSVQDIDEIEIAG